jgi:hypothetical protein
VKPRHEGRDGVALLGGDVAGRFRPEQRQVAFLRILARLGPFGPNRIERRAGLDAGQ